MPVSSFQTMSCLYGQNFTDHGSCKSARARRLQRADHILEVSDALRFGLSGTAYSATAGGRPALSPAARFAAASKPWTTPANPVAARLGAQLVAICLIVQCFDLLTFQRKRRWRGNIRLMFLRTQELTAGSISAVLKLQGQFNEAESRPPNVHWAAGLEKQRLACLGSLSTSS